MSKKELLIYEELLNATQKHYLLFLFFAFPRRKENFCRDMVEKQFWPSENVPAGEVDEKGDFVFKYECEINAYFERAIELFGPGNGAEDAYWSLDELDCSVFNQCSKEMSKTCHTLFSLSNEEACRILIQKVKGLVYDQNFSEWLACLAVKWNYPWKLKEVICEIRKSKMEYESEKIAERMVYNNLFLLFQNLHNILDYMAACKYIKANLDLNACYLSTLDQIKKLYPDKLGLKINFQNVFDACPVEVSVIFDNSAAFQREWENGLEKNLLRIIGVFQGKLLQNQIEIPKDDLFRKAINQTERFVKSTLGIIEKDWSYEKKIDQDVKEFHSLAQAKTKPDASENDCKIETKKLEFNIPACLEQLAERVTVWAEELGDDSKYYDDWLQEGGSNEWGQKLRDETERDLLNPTLSALIVQGRGDMVEDLRSRFNDLYAQAQAYQEQLEAIESQRRLDIEYLIERHKQAFPEDTRGEHLGSLCQGVDRIWHLWPDGNPLTAPEHFAEAIDEVKFRAVGSKGKAKGKIKRLAMDVAAHLNILAAFFDTNTTVKPDDVSFDTSSTQNDDPFHSLRKDFGVNCDDCIPSHNLKNPNFVYALGYSWMTAATTICSSFKKGMGLSDFPEPLSFGFVIAAEALADVCERYRISSTPINRLRTTLSSNINQHQGISSIPINQLFHERDKTNFKRLDDIYWDACETIDRLIIKCKSEVEEKDLIETDIEQTIKPDSLPPALSEETKNLDSLKVENKSTDKRSLSQKEINSLTFQILTDLAKRKEKITARKVAEKIGCSVSCMSKDKNPAWRRYMDTRKKRRTLNALSLPESNILEDKRTIPDIEEIESKAEQQKELDELIRQQKDDDNADRFNRKRRKQV